MQADGLQRDKGSFYLPHFQLSGMCANRSMNVYELANTKFHLPVGKVLICATISLVEANKLTSVFKDSNVSLTQVVT